MGVVFCFELLLLVLSLTPFLCIVAPSFLLFAAIGAVALSAGDVHFAAGCWILRHFGNALWLLVPLVLDVVGNAPWLLVPLVLAVVGIVAFLVLFLCAAPLLFCVVGTGAAAFLLTFALLLALRCVCWHCNHCCFCLSSCTVDFCAALVPLLFGGIGCGVSAGAVTGVAEAVVGIIFVLCRHGCFMLLALALAF